jgi:hypothetical protein
MSESMNDVIRQGFGRRPPASRTDDKSDEKPALEEMSASEVADKLEGMLLDSAEAAAVLVAKIREQEQPDEEEGVPR